MSEVILYPEMNAKIADILRFSDDMPHDLYAAAYIEHLQAEVERLTRERDAAVRDLTYTDNCDACVHNVKRAECGLDCEDCTLDCTCRACFNGDTAWQWRGLCAQNQCGEATDMVGEAHD